MPVIGTYNGASILLPPSRPSYRQVALKKHNSNAVLASPFTGQVQVQSWPGADWWYAELTFPQMTVGDAAAWSAFLSSCRGMFNVFPWGHPLYTSPTGTANGHDVPVCNGASAAMTTSLTTRGWRPNQPRLLNPGDYLQIGATPTTASAGEAGLCRLHEVIDPVNSDTNGDATINVWPSLRETTTDAEVIVLNKPQGLFRLGTNDTSTLSTETRLFGISLQIVEAR